MRGGHYYIKLNKDYALFELSAMIEDINSYVGGHNYRIVNDFEVETESDNLLLGHQADFDREKDNLEGFFELDTELLNDKLPEIQIKKEFVSLLRKYFQEEEIKILEIK